MSFNYCFIDKNKMYEDIYDILELNDLHMGNVEEDTKIFSEIMNYIDNEIVNGHISFSETFSDRDKFLDTIIETIAIDGSTGTVKADTITIFSDENETYELMYAEHPTKDELHEKLNQFATMTNCNLTPIYGKCIIVKTIHSNNIVKNTIMTKNDLHKVLLTNFYHKGIMLDGENMTELTYADSMPYKVIGNTFTNYDIVDIFGFKFICYNDNSPNNKENKIASTLLDKPITNRVFIALLSFIKNKKIWNVSINLIKKILEIKSNNEIFKKINNEIFNSPNENYFLILSKY